MVRLGVKLTKGQIKRIDPLMAEADYASDSGKPGMVVAQIFDGVLKCTFIDHEKALEFQKIMDLFDPGTTIGGDGNE